MRYLIDDQSGCLTIEGDGAPRRVNLFSPEGFEALSDLWVRVGWDQRYGYNFTWMGRPVIQMPEDMVRAQEVLFSVQPDVILETGVAHGGSLIYYASLCRVMGRGRVIGIDIEIRPHNRRAIEEHFLSPYITLIEGSSTDAGTLEKVKQLLGPNETTIVFLDSCHTYEHVSAELEAYAPLVTPGSWIVATDGIMESLHDVPRGCAEWRTDNPSAAARDFAAKHPEFLLQQPEWPFNESPLRRNITHWPGAWLQRRPQDPPQSADEAAAV